MHSAAGTCIGFSELWLDGCLVLQACLQFCCESSISFLTIWESLAHCCWSSSVGLLEAAASTLGVAVRDDAAGVTVSWTWRWSTGSVFAGRRLHLLSQLSGCRTCASRAARRYELGPSGKEVVVAGDDHIDKVLIHVPVGPTELE